jgi:hypothetical protein
MEVEKKDHKLYEKILDVILILRDTRELFHPYSAQDIKKLIAAKMKNVQREPPNLRELYRLEAMITDLRLSMKAAKEEHDAVNPGSHSPS